MWSDLQQEEIRRELVNTSISESSNNGLKGEKEKDNVALASKGPSQGQGS